MPSQYIVVQFGNVMTGEYLNIGIFAYDMAADKPEVCCRFLTNWSRIEAAFGKDIFLMAVVENMKKKIAFKEELNRLIKECDSPYSSLRFTLPRGSLLGGQELVDNVAKVFLVE